jgi:hypothetical protein
MIRIFKASMGSVATSARGGGGGGGGVVQLNRIDNNGKELSIDASKVTGSWFKLERRWDLRGALFEGE